MPRTLLTDEYWSKLLVILLELGLYEKPNLRNVIEGILYRMRTGCPWRDYRPLSANFRLFITALTVGQKKELSIIFSKYCQPMLIKNG